MTSQDYVKLSISSADGDLAAQWRAAHGDLGGHKALVEAYYKVIKDLYDRGWDGELNLESHLPDEFMPAEYVMRNPHIRLNPAAWGDPKEWYSK